MGEQVLFFQGKLPAIEWNAKLERANFEFHRKYLKTDDPKLIDRLRKLGYQEIKTMDAVMATVDPRIIKDLADKGLKIVPIEQPVKTVQGNKLGSSTAGSSLDSESTPRLARDLES